MGIAVEAALQGKQVLWAAPTYKQVTIGWRECVNACAHLLKERYVTANKTEQMWVWPKGGRMYFVSLEDPDNARGYTADVVIVDEAGDVPEYAVKDVIRPMLMDTQGSMWAIGTPRGRNWFWEAHDKAKLQWLEYQAGRRAVMPNRMSWEVPSHGCEILIDEKTGAPYPVRKRHPLENPQLPWSELLDMWEDMTEQTFRQEVMAQFIDNTDGVFIRFADAIDRGDSRNKPWNQFGEYVMGVDVATIRDYTVLFVLDKTTNKQVYFQRFNNRGWERVYDDVERIAREYKAQVNFDATGVGEPAAQELQRRGVWINPIKFNNQLKKDMVQHAAALIEHKRVSFLDIPQQQHEFEAFEYGKTPSGLITANAPEGKNDDCVSAGILAMWGWRPGMKDGGSQVHVSIGEESELTSYAFHMEDNLTSSLGIFS
jgi:predicted protein tyrosine phosphatase